MCTMKTKMAACCTAFPANDWIGYLPNFKAHPFGGYQTWMGPHNYADPGTGERVADQIVSMLKELAGK